MPNLPKDIDLQCRQAWQFLLSSIKSQPKQKYKFILFLHLFLQLFMNFDIQIIDYTDKSRTMTME